MPVRCSGPQDTAESLGRAAALAAREAAAVLTQQLLQADRMKRLVLSTKKDRKRRAKANAANGNNNDNNNNNNNNNDMNAVIVAMAVSLEVGSSITAAALEPLPHSDALPSLGSSPRGDVPQLRRSVLIQSSVPKPLLHLPLADDIPSRPDMVSHDQDPLPGMSLLVHAASPQEGARHALLILG